MKGKSTHGKQPVAQAIDSTMKRKASQHYSSLSLKPRQFSEAKGQPTQLKINPHYSRLPLSLQAKSTPRPQLPGA